MPVSQNTLAGRIAFFFLCFFALGLAFSISIAQTGLGIVFLIFIATLATRRGRESVSCAAAPRLRILYFAFWAWVAWRIYHVLLAPDRLGELIEAREVWLMLIPLFVYLYASSRKRLLLLVASFVLGVALSSAYGIWQLRADFFNMVRGRGLSTMHHLNFAGMAALASLLGFGLALAYNYAGHKKRALVFAFFTMLALLGLWLTKSRGTIAAFGIVLPVFIFAQIHNRVQRWIFLVAVACIAFFALRHLPEKIVEEYKFPPSDVHAGSQAERRDLWQTGLAMVRERPLTGWGDRGYNRDFPHYQVAGAVGVAAYDAKNNEASHMHNDFINTAVLYGLVGLAIQLFYYFFGFGIYLRDRFRLSRASDRTLAAAAAACIPLMALMGLTQCHFTSEIVQMSFWLAIGVLFTTLETDRAGNFE